MTSPGRRNMGPPYSHAQLPGGSWSWEKKERPFSAASSGVFAEGRSGRPWEYLVSLHVPYMRMVLSVRTVSMPRKYLSAALCGHAFTSSSVCR
jgi:hypothetical protein